MESVRKLRAAALADLEGDRPGPKSPNTLILIDLLIGTGGRIGELTALKVGDFDPKAGTLLIGAHVSREQYTEVYVKGRKAGVVDQLVYLPAPAIASLKAHVAGRGPEEFILASQSGGMCQTNNLRRSLRRLEKLAGVERFSPHVFRRTVGTTVANGLDSAAMAAAQLGNTEEVARAHYIKAKNTGPKEAAALLEGFYEPPTPEPEE